MAPEEIQIQMKNWTQRDREKRGVNKVRKPSKQQKFENMLLDMIVDCGFPMDISSQPTFVKWVKYTNPNYTIPTMEQLSTTVWARRSQKKQASYQKNDKLEPVVSEEPVYMEQDAEV